MAMQCTPSYARWLLSCVYLLRQPLTVFPTPGEVSIRICCRQGRGAVCPGGMHAGCWRHLCLVRHQQIILAVRHVVGCFTVFPGAYASWCCELGNAWLTWNATPVTGHVGWHAACWVAGCGEGCWPVGSAQSPGVRAGCAVPELPGWYMSFALLSC